MSPEQSKAKQLMVKFNSRLFNAGHSIPKQVVKEFVLVAVEEAENITGEYLRGKPIDFKILAEEVKRL